jgi:hypothetical protein
LSIAKTKNSNRPGDQVAQSQGVGKSSFHTLGSKIIQTRPRTQKLAFYLQNNVI